MFGIDKETEELYYVEFSAKTNVRMWGTTNEERQPEYDLWQGYTDSQIAKAPDQLKSLIQSSIIWP